MLLSKFDITYVNQSSVKGQALADQLAIGYDDIEEWVKFQNEDIMAAGSNEETESSTPKWKLYFDGAANVYSYWIGAILVSPRGN